MYTRKIEQEQVFMNTIIRITLYSDKSTIYSQEKIQQAFDCFGQVVKKYTRFNSKSELAKLNNSGGKPFKVSADFFYLIEYMLDLSKLTDGSYDPTIIDLLETYGYGENRNFEALDDPDLFKNIQQLIAHRPKPTEIKLDKKNLTVQLAPRQRLDLGSIGKGYAVDLAYDVLSDFPAFMINAGGDIRVKGPKPESETSEEEEASKEEMPKQKTPKGEMLKEASPDDNNWQIALYKAQLPNKALQQDNLLGTINLKEGSVCGSGGWARKVRFFHHLLNPKTGMPINEISQTFVIAPTAIEADTWATVLFTLGEKGLELLKSKKLAGIVVDKDGKISQTGSIL